ncbi:MAG: hypothetical protein ABFD92_18280 [Planctomycetaceae bacterium]
MTQPQPVRKGTSISKALVLLTYIVTMAGAAAASSAAYYEPHNVPAPPQKPNSFSAFRWVTVNGQTSISILDKQLGEDGELWLAGGAVMAMIALAVYLFTLFNMWSAILSTARMAPSSALLLFLVPCLNTVWAMIVAIVWALDYNKLRDRRRLSLPVAPIWLASLLGLSMPAGLFWIIGPVAPFFVIPHMILVIWFLNFGCNAINILSAAHGRSY